MGAPTGLTGAVSVRRLSANVACDFTASIRRTHAEVVSVVGRDISMEREVGGFASSQDVVRPFEITRW